MIMEYARTGDKPPDVAVRSHRHQFAESGRNFAVRWVQTPAWQLASAYVKSYAPVSLADIGVILFICDHGSYSMEPILYSPRRQKTWKTSTRNSPRRMWPS